TRTSPPPRSSERPRGSLTAGHFHPATVATAPPGLLTMEVSGRYGRTRAGISDHVSPANGRVALCRWYPRCPRMCDLMYPSRTRGLLPVLTTENESGCTHPHRELVRVEGLARFIRRPKRSRARGLPRAKGRCSTRKT